MTNSTSNIYVGTAAWNLPKHVRDFFPQEGSILEKYASRFNGVEINSSFYRDHRGKTYLRWKDSVPDNFRFAVKLSRVFTHEQRLQHGDMRLEPVLKDMMLLGNKLAVLLVQLPPSLAFQNRNARIFFEELRETYDGFVAFEPRHMTWNIAEALQLTEEFKISRVWADPQPIPHANFTAAADSLVYYRLHGSPEIYKSDYDRESLFSYAKKLLSAAPSSHQVWCIFDNTTFGHATTNALILQENLSSHLTW